jgi:hypothetical protein
MTRRPIEHFLAILAKELGRPAKLYLTGAAAAALWGRVRPSIDIDFGIEAPVRGGRNVSVEEAVDRTTRLSGIAASFAEDIDRWGMITLLDYRRSSRVYARFGALEVRLLHPVNWAIGKLTRFLEPDVRDVIEVFRRQAVDSKLAARTWGRALRASPASTAQALFRSQVEYLFRHHGRRIWGPKFDADDAVKRFGRAARITGAARRAP